MIHGVAGRQGGGLADQSQPVTGFGRGQSSRAIVVVGRRARRAVGELPREGVCLEIPLDQLSYQWRQQPGLDQNPVGRMTRMGDRDAGHRHRFGDLRDMRAVEREPVVIDNEGRRRRTGQAIDAVVDKDDPVPVG